MRTKRRNSLFSTLLIFGLILPGLIGIFAVQAKAIEDQNLITQLSLQSGLSATPTWTLTNTPTPILTSTESLFTNPSFPLDLSSVDLYAFIQAPSKIVARPYVILTAFASIPRSGSVEIRGFLNSQEFICVESPCALYLQSSTRLIFRAYANTGESSEEVVASVSVNQALTGYKVTIDTVSQFTSFADACANIWGKRDEDNANWDNFVQFPYQLNTDKTLHTLAGRLILNGVVDARDCPAGGLSIGLDWPTACGLQKAAETTTAWQNQFDGYIWLASRDYGIPPKILKTLIEFESQFWPGNSRFYLDEVGLGQINQLGVDVLLRRDPTYYQKICPSVLSDCSRPYGSLEPSQQAQIRGALVNSVDAVCPTCENGVDLDKAKRSIDLVTGLLKANCQQVNDIVKRPYEPDPDADAATATAVVATIVAGGTSPAMDYEDLWKFTLASYHSGVSCFQDAVLATKKNRAALTWENVSKELKCKGGADYVNGYWDNITAFDFYLYEPGDLLSVISQPTIVPTRTPVPTPTVFISNARVIVQVYMDRNGNGAPDAGEWIDAMTVQVSVSNTEKLTQRTSNGVAIFDMTGYPPNSGIDVSLPGLYRNETFLLPEQGDVTIVFKFDQPVLPTTLP
jgi:hypothetical protein